MKQAQILLILLISLSAGLAACQPTTATEAPATAATVTATNGDKTAVITKGEVVPLRQATLSFQNGGQVLSVLVANGDLVQVGDPLVQLDDTNQQIAVTQGEVRLAQAQANQQIAESLLALAQTNLETAQLGVTAAQTRLDILAEDPAAAQVAALESQVAVAQANVGLASANRNAMLETASEAQIYAAQSQLTAAEAARLPIQGAYNQLPEETTAETVAHVEQVQMQLNAAQAQVNAAQAALSQLQEGASAAQQQAANAVVAAAAAQRDAAQARLDLLLAGPKPEQRQLAEIEVSHAEALVAQAELAVLQAEKGVTEAETGVERAQIAWDVAQSALEQATLHAPFTGVITRLAARPGEVVGTGSPVLTLADLSGWQVKTNDLTELDVVLLQVGLPVMVQIEALLDEALRGQVVDIATVSRLNQGDVTYVASILLDETSLPVRWGMTATVEIDVNGGE